MEGEGGLEGRSSNESTSPSQGCSGLDSRRLQPMKSAAGLSRRTGREPLSSSFSQEPVTILTSLKREMPGSAQSKSYLRTRHHVHYAAEGESEERERGERERWKRE